MNVYSFNYSTVIFFPNPKTSELFKKMSPTNLFYIGLRTLKPTRMRTLSRIPIGQGVIRVGLYRAAISRTVISFTTVNMKFMFDLCHNI